MNNTESHHEEYDPVSTSSSGAFNGNTAIYPVHTVNIKGSSRPVTVFMDSGSNASYITKSCAERHNLKKIKTVSLGINTVGGARKKTNSSIFEVPIVTRDKKVVVIQIYSLSHHGVNQIGVLIFCNL